MGLGTLVNGTNFSDIGAAIYDGTNATSADFLAGKASFILDGSGHIYYDPDGVAAGYKVVADINGGDNPVASDLEIVAAV